MNTREQWLSQAVTALRPLFSSTGLDLPDTVHVSVGFPSTRALSVKRRRIGECWQSIASSDSNPHIFVTPLKDDSIEVLGILVHELIHAAGVGGHGADFKRPAIAVGLTGKMTQTEVGDDLRQRLNDLVIDLGPYPHSLLDPGNRPVKKQTTRLLKCECVDCGMIIRLTSKYIDDPGLPFCACGGDFELRTKGTGQ